MSRGDQMGFVFCLFGGDIQAVLRAYSWLRDHSWWGLGRPSGDLGCWALNFGGPQVRQVPSLWSSTSFLFFFKHEKHKCISKCRGKLAELLLCRLLKLTVSWEVNGPARTHSPGRRDSVG